MASRFQAPAVCVCLLFLTAYGKQQQSRQAAEPAGAAIRIERLDPSYTAQGRAFNVQPGGKVSKKVVFRISKE